MFYYSFNHSVPVISVKLMTGSLQRQQPGVLHGLRKGFPMSVWQHGILSPVDDEKGLRHTPYGAVQFFCAGQQRVIEHAFQ